MSNRQLCVGDAMSEPPNFDPRKQLTESEQAVLEVAVVLQEFDASMLNAVYGSEATAELTVLVQRGVLTLTDGTYRVDEAVHRDVLARLDKRFIDIIDERAIQYLAAQIPHVSGSAAWDLETQMMRHIERRCEQLIQRVSPDLGNVLNSIPHKFFEIPAHIQRLTYYRGLALGFQKRYADARHIFASLLSNPATESQLRMRVLNSDATFARYCGDYQAALDGYAQSLQLARAMGNKDREALALMNQGMFHYYLQNYDAAGQDLTASLALFQELGIQDRVAHVHTNLGLLARDRADWSAALNHSMQAAQYFRRRQDDEFRGRVTNNLGEIAMLQGQFDLALTHFDQARALLEKERNVYLVDLLLNCGLVHQAQGNHEMALAEYHTALHVATELQRNESRAKILYQIGHAEMQLGQLQDSARSYAAAIDAIENTNAAIANQELLISLNGRWQQVYEAAILLCLKSGDVTGAFHYTERARARAFATLLARHQASAVGSTDRPATAQEVRSALPHNTVFLSYMTTGLHGPERTLLDAIPSEAAGLRSCLDTPARLLVFAVTAQGLRCHPLDFNPQPLHSEYQPDGQRFLDLLPELYRILIAPIADLLSQDVKVVIAAHGPLHQIPFAAIGQAEGRTLLDEVMAISYTPSASVWIHQRPRELVAPAPCLAIGYDGPASRRLRHTEPEAEAIAMLCGGVVWRGRAGISAQFLEDAGRYRWLHIACHGQYDMIAPLYSWLEVGPGERLRATDILQSGSLQADIVTLSACESGVAAILRGDEPMGLVRAFLSAGARAVLVTLWPVEDRSARLLMEYFYQRLIEEGAGFPPEEALASAQRYLRTLTASALAQLDGRNAEGAEDPKSGVRPFELPYYWAAYQVVESAGSTITSI
jgi:CHAT domain-containing protein/tetratricopeptide (TPR) repeat protein